MHNPNAVQSTFTEDDLEDNGWDYAELTVSNGNEFVSNVQAAYDDPALGLDRNTDHRAVICISSIGGRMPMEGRSR